MATGAGWDKMVRMRGAGVLFGRPRSEVGHSKHDGSAQRLFLSSPGDEGGDQTSGITRLETRARGGSRG